MIQDLLVFVKNKSQAWKINSRLEIQPNTAGVSERDPDYSIVNRSLGIQGLTEVLRIDQKL